MTPLVGPSEECRTEFATQARFLAGLVSAADPRVPAAARELAARESSAADEPETECGEPPFDDSDHSRPDRPSGPEWRRFGPSRSG